MGAGLDHDSPIHFQFQHTLKHHREQSRVVNQVLESVAAPSQCQGFVVQAGLPGCCTTHVQDTTPGHAAMWTTLPALHLLSRPKEQEQTEQEALQGATL